MRFSAASLLGLAATALSLDITLYLPAKPNPFALAPSTHATLSTLGAHLSAPITSVNTFVFRNVSAAPSSYLVDVHAPSDNFQPLRLDVLADGSIQVWETFRGNDWGNKGEAIPVKKGSAGVGVELRAVGRKNYFMERPQFSVLTILKNPMILMGLVSMGIFIGMPYIMDNMDPEMKAEFEARQAESPLSSLMGGGGASSGGGAGREQGGLGNFDMAAYLAGSNKKDGEGEGSKGQGVRR